MDTRTKLIMLFNEGKVWDKVKKVWRDHKGKIIAGAGAIAAVGAYKVGHKKGQDSMPKPKKASEERLLDRYKKELLQARKELNASGKDDKKAVYKWKDARDKYNNIKAKLSHKPTKKELHKHDMDTILDKD